MTDSGVPSPLGPTAARRHREAGPLRHLEWVIMMFTIAHAVLGAVFVLYGWWAPAATTVLSAAAWLTIGRLIACA